MSEHGATDAVIEAVAIDWNAIPVPDWACMKEWNPQGPERLRWVLCGLLDQAMPWTDEQDNNAVYLDYERYEDARCAIIDGVIELAKKYLQPVQDGHGIYRTADVEALLAFYESYSAYDAADGASGPALIALVDACSSAQDAITPELLARCRKGE